MTRRITSPKSVAQIPTINRGEPITAAYLNQMGAAINEFVLNAPRDLDSGVTAGEVAGITLQETGRTSETVRITNPEDEAQFVDVARAQTVTMRKSDTGELWVMIFENG